MDTDWEYEYFKRDKSQWTPSELSAIRIGERLKRAEDRLSESLAREQRLRQSLRLIRDTTSGYASKVARATLHEIGDVDPPEEEFR